MNNPRFVAAFLLALLSIQTAPVAAQGWEYQWGANTYPSLIAFENALHAAQDGNGADHQLAFPALDRYSHSSLTLKSTVDYRVAGTFYIGAKRKPIAQTYPDIYGLLDAAGNWVPVPTCLATPTRPAGWCSNDPAVMSSYLQYRATQNCALVPENNNNPTGGHSTFLTRVRYVEHPTTALLHGAAGEYEGTRVWRPQFKCGTVTFPPEYFRLVKREHFFCPQYWRLNPNPTISSSGITLAQVLPDVCYASVSGIRSFPAMEAGKAAQNGEPSIDEKELAEGPPADGPPGCPQGNPCSPLSGKKTATEFDFSAAGIDFNRYYDSVFENRDFGNLSRGWSHSFSDRVLTDHFTPGHGTATCELAYRQNERGAIDRFIGTAPAPMRSEANSEELLQCVNDGDRRWLLSRPDGSQRFYNAAGYPINIRFPDQPQHSLTLTWSQQLGYGGQEYGPRRLDRVETATGRALVFSYFTEGEPLLKEIRDQAGQILATYLYEQPNFAPTSSSGGFTFAIGHLTEARTTDQTRRYQYEDGRLSKIQEVSANGLVVTDYATYFYDEHGRGQSSKHAGDTLLTTFTYATDGTSGTATLPEGAVATFTSDGSFYRRPLTASKGIGAHRHTSTYTYQGSGTGEGRRLTHSVRISDSTSSTTRYVYAADWLRPSAMIEAEGALEERTTRYLWNLERNQPTSVSIERCNRAALGQPCSPVVESIQRRSYNAQQQLSAACAVDPAVPAAVAYTCGSAQHAPTGVRQTRYAYCASALGTAACPYAGWLMSVDGPRTDVNDVSTFEYRTTTPAACTTTPLACDYRKGDLYAQVNALGHRSEILAYDPAGRILRSKDENNVLTDRTWHPRGWLLSQTQRADPAGTANALDATTTYTYERFGSPRRITGPDGDYIESCYDAAQRVTAVVLNPGSCAGTATPSGGDAVLFTLRGDGRREVERIVDSSNTVFHRLSRQFDNLGLLLTVRDSRDETTGSPLAGADLLLALKGRRVAAYGYDGRGLRVGLEDGRQLLPGNDPLSHAGRSTDYTLDALGRTIAMADAQGLDSVPANRGTTQFQYDARNHVVHVIDPNKLVTRYTYNALGDLTRLDSPDTGATTYVHDAAGNEVSRTDARNVQTLSSYDVLGRLTQTSYAGNPLITNPGANSYAYDLENVTTGCSSAGATASFPVGRLSRMTDPSGITTFCYDRRGNLLRKSQVDANFSPTATEVVYTYSKADRIASITYPSGARVDYTRNAEGQVSAINRVVGGVTTSVVTSAGYRPTGMLSALTFANGDVLAKTYDPNELPTSIHLSNASDGGGASFDLDYSTDVLGNVTRVSQVVGGSTQVQRYAYDPVYRLQAVQSDSLVTLEQYSYDKTGNRLSKQFGAQAAEAYDYSNNPAAPVYPGDPGYASYSHRLNWIGGNGATRFHDESGNTLTLANFGLADTYIGLDARNRNTQQSVFSVFSMAQSLQYNGFGERTTRTAVMGTAGTRSQYYYNETGQTLGRYDLAFTSGGGDDSKSRKAVPANAAYQEYIWLDDTPVAVFDKASNGTTQLAFLSTDHLNTPRLARVGFSDVWRWDLVAGNPDKGTKVAAFGEATPQLQTLKIDLRFPGQLHDPLTGLHYNYFRDYEPATGRYTQSDPIGLAGGIGSYGYADQNPLAASDPKGLCPWCIPMLAQGIRICMRNPNICIPKLPPIPPLDLPPPPNGKVPYCYGPWCGPPPGCFDPPMNSGDEDPPSAEPPRPDSDNGPKDESARGKDSPDDQPPKGPHPDDAKKLRKLSDAEAAKLDPHGEKGKAGSRRDLYKDGKGNVYEVLKGGKGEPQPLYINVKDAW